MEKVKVKKCTKCGEIKSYDMFNKDRTAPDGYMYRCRECAEIARKIYKKNNYDKILERDRINRKSYKNKIKQIYDDQKIGCARKNKKRNTDVYKVEYTLEELTTFMENNGYKELYDDWIKSDYDMHKAPSIDRLDDYIGYRLDNIRLIIFGENKNRSYSDIKSGINTKNSRAVVQYTLDGEYVDEFHSTTAAANHINKSLSIIYLCCKGVNNTAGGYVWKYKYKDKLEGEKDKVIIEGENNGKE